MLSNKSILIGPSDFSLKLTLCRVKHVCACIFAVNATKNTFTNLQDDNRHFPSVSWGKYCRNIILSANTFVAFVFVNAKF